ncbi:CDF family Co(II)/Ni(II) efflux transporter DmeF [Herbaspirillum seropedicae]|uniref:Co/Zn/Cd efflux system component protein n=2 Tax=Herbaspirillum seropedicae TaxID=964 RepID=D8ISH3_HERSS|nr:CDF family Co(II)/Ni(II) efflux transporter DmeF [Herbaspirillum seropedicae]ADJ63517.1 Co/Zn/Cd efflux system component protein [Herbaspirillum seropedicae SmR1]AKN65550.1 cation transporter [Herbaspirillum seropedicae]NQE28709.1 cation transporter [Herbaspirillum seropedicae]UMU21514.1 CDF family Co(II)/Ni(II) efflux transporter DmeF [Herbaspirillum seropedicae]CAM32666.1 Co/Zn/Cd efflux system component protein [Herbaspirillum seropedicae]
MQSTSPFRHEHVYLGANHDRNTRRTLWVVVLTAVMMVAEIAAGYLTGSMALLADGFHMATHTGALAIAAGAYVFARRHAHDQRFSFGTGKVGDLAGFASALVLAVIAIGIGGGSLWRLASPSPVEFGEAIVIAVIGLMVNIASALLLMEGHHHDHAHHDAHAHHAHHTHHTHHSDHGHGKDHPPHHHAHAHDNNLRSAYLHVVADALTSVLAIAALLAGLYLGWTWLDPAMGVVGAVVIARWSYSLLRASATVLLDVTDEQVATRIRQALADEPVQIDDLHVWRIGPTARAAIVSLSGPAEQEETPLRQKLAALEQLQHLSLEYRRLPA